MRWILPLLGALLLAGCTQVEDAQQALEDAQRDAQEARDRYDRLRGATLLRDERLTVVVVPMTNETTLWFDAGAWRGETLVPADELTTLPAVRVQAEGLDVTCQPQECAMSRPTGNATVTWADGATGEVPLVHGHNGCELEEPAESYCALRELRREVSIPVKGSVDEVAR